MGKKKNFCNTILPVQTASPQKTKRKEGDSYLMWVIEGEIELERPREKHLTLYNTVS